MIETLLALEREQRFPPVEQWQPEQRGRMDLTIRADGSWWHEGAPIRRERLVKLLASILRHDEEGYWLVTPYEQLSVTVEDVPFLGVDLASGPDQDGAHQLVVTTNVGDVVALGEAHTLWVEDPEASPRPYVHVRGGLNARLTRPVFYRLVDGAEVRDGVVWVESQGRAFPLGSAGD